MSRSGLHAVTCAAQPSSHQKYRRHSSGKHTNLCSPRPKICSACCSPRRISSDGGFQSTSWILSAACNGYWRRSYGMGRHHDCSRIDILSAFRASQDIRVLYNRETTTAGRRYRTCGFNGSWSPPFSADTSKADAGPYLTHSN
jgi:hypothetical protein